MKTRLYNNFQSVLMFLCIDDSLPTFFHTNLNISIWRIESSEFHIDVLLLINLFGSLYHDDVWNAFQVIFMLFQWKGESRESEGHTDTFSFFCLFAFINLSGLSSASQKSSQQLVVQWELFMSNRLVQTQQRSRE